MEQSSGDDGIPEALAMTHTQRPGNIENLQHSTILQEGWSFPNSGHCLGILENAQFLNLTVYISQDPNGLCMKGSKYQTQTICYQKCQQKVNVEWLE